VTRSEVVWFAVMQRLQMKLLPRSCRVFWEMTALAGFQHSFIHWSDLAVQKNSALWQVRIPERLPFDTWQCTRVAQLSSGSASLLWLDWRSLVS